MIKMGKRYKLLKIKIWDWPDIFAFFLALICLYQLLVSNNILPYLIKSDLELWIQISISYLSGYILYFLTSFLKWYRKTNSSNLIIKEKLNPLIIDFFSIISFVTHRRWETNYKILDHLEKRKTLSVFQTKAYRKEFIDSIICIDWAKGNNKKYLHENIYHAILNIKKVSFEIYTDYLPYLNKSCIRILDNIRNNDIDRKIKALNTYPKDLIKYIAEDLYKFKLTLEKL